MDAQTLERLLTNQADIIQQLKSRNAASIWDDSRSRPRKQLRMVIPLDVAATEANPFVISNPFNGFYVVSATDANVSVNLSLTSPEKQNITEYTSIKLNDSGTFSEPIRAAYLTWSAQTGKSITIMFYLGIDFRPGSLVSAISGGVVITTGTGMTPVASVSVATTATLIAAADSTRKKTTIQNLGMQDVFISGTNTVVGTGAALGLNGIKLQPGALYEWTNTGAIYGIAVGAASVVSINTET